MPQPDRETFDDRFRSQSRRALGAAAVLGLAVVFLLVGLLSGPTFLYSPIWWGVVAALAALGLGLVLRARKGGAAVKAEAAAIGLDLRTLQRGAAPSRPRVMVWTLLLIGWISSLVLVGRPALAAAEIGGSTQRAVALQAVSWSPCSRCSQRAKAQIVVGGRLRDVALRGVAQDPSYYTAGIVVVFKAGDPAVAMASADYEDGTGPVPAVVVSTATALFLAGTWALMRIRVRR